ncbi:MAG: TauD/TfdA family dioxygenase [Novosphingobium sp.]
MSQPREYATPGGLAVRRTQPAIGAVVSGIDLAKPIADHVADDLRKALYAHGVIFLRGQEHIGFAEHLAFAELFGTPIDDGPDPARPMITPVASKAGRREGTASTWHTDGCYLPTPPAASILRAIEPCPFGGDTLWASSAAAYAGLPDDLREQIESLTFRSSLAERMPRNNASFGSAEKWEELRAKYPSVHQPVVNVHPVTGTRALYVNLTWSLGIDHMEEAAGQALIDRLSREYMRPEYQVRWQWRPGDLAVWDNRLVMHYGVPDQTTDRYLERISVKGEPILSIADSTARSAALQPA